MYEPDNKITLVNFNALPSHEKLDRTYLDGVFLTERTAFGFIIEIYALNNFFVEIWYGGLKDGESPYVKIKSFRSIKRVDPYFHDESSFCMLKDVNY